MLSRYRKVYLTTAFALWFVERGHLSSGDLRPHRWNSSARRNIDTVGGNARLLSSAGVFHTESPLDAKPASPGERATEQALVRLPYCNFHCCVLITRASLPGATLLLARPPAPAHPDHSPCSATVSLAAALLPLFERDVDSPADLSTHHCHFSVCTLFVWVRLVRCCPRDRTTPS